MIKTICDSVNHTRFLKEDHLPDWARRNKVTEGDRVECVSVYCDMAIAREYYAVFGPMEIG